MLIRPLLAAMALLFAVLGGGCRSGDPSNTATATPPSRTVGANESALHQARLDAATRTGSDPLDVKLVELRAAGWDGCLGVKQAGPCAEFFVGGLVAIFDSGGKQLRYHIAGGRVVGPIDPALASDGSPVPPDLAPDLPAILAEYTRYDAALRDKIDVSTIAVEAIIPAAFPGHCRITSPAGGCIAAMGAFVQLSGGNAAYADATQAGAFVVNKASESGGTGVADSPLFGLQLAMRQDLAARLKVDVGTISMRSYESVTWPDGCLGIERPGVACAQSLVPGFLATLTDGAGKPYRYDGTGTKFVAASFEPNARLSDPLRNP
jgi:hypothetical protein